MKAEQPLTKADQRRLMQEFELARREADRELPEELRHDQPAWTEAFWKARQVMT